MAEENRTVEYPVSYTYDYAGRMKTMTTTGSSGNVITAWNYSTTTGRLVSKRYNSNASGSTGSGPDYQYTSGGRLSARLWARPISTTNPTRVTTTYGYTWGRLTSLSYNDGTPNLGYTYDNLGRLRTVTRGGASHYIYDYDPATLRLATEQQNIDTFPRNLHRHYDNLGRPLSLNLATTGGTSQYTTGYAYDDAGRLLNVWHMPVLDTMTKAPTGSPTFTYGYTYTQANPGDLRVGAGGGAGQEDFMPYTVTRNAAGGNPALTANRTYEGTRDVLHKIENKAGATVVSSYTYTVNPISQRTSVATAGTAFAGTQADWAWGYDALGQLTSADHATTNAADRAYQYDTIGNREKSANGTLSLPGTANWISNALNQYTTADGVALPTTPAPAPFDLDGNLTAGPVPGSNGNLAGNQPPANATDIKWDGEGRLASLKIGTTTYGYQYDHLSRMITRTQNGAVTNRYAYDGWNRITQYSGDTLQTRYTWGLDLSGTMQGAGGVGGLLGTRLSNGADYFPTYDGNGNVSEYIHTAGSIAVHFEYDPFGRLTHVAGTPQTQSRFEFRFSTKPRDAATGLYYYGYRWYDPYTGRWINRDPIEESGGVNLYGFVGNDALADFDVLGLRPRPPWDLNGCWQPQPDIRPTKISGDAGIDVKPAVDKTLAEVDKFFESLTPDQKVCACQAIALDNAHMLIFYPLLWDIQELRTIIPGTDGGDWHPGEEGRTYWGYGAATWVLTFGGEPYTSYSINYALWGRMYKNCATTDRDKFSLGNAQIIVNTYKLMQTFVEGVLPKPLGQYETMPVDINGATAFTQYGYTGTLPPDPRGCLRSLFNPSSKKLDKVLEWRWLPYKE